MAQIVDLQAARERRAERFIESSRELRGEMARLCGDLQHAIGRLKEAREALDRARIGIETSRSRMQRLRGLAAAPPVAAERPRLRLVSG